MDKKANHQQSMSRAQEKAKSFIEKHNVEKIISEMLNSLVHSRDPNPVVFMIKYLSTLVTEQELEECGIKVSGPMPQRIPIITYPKFDPECNSLLKKHLTREIWSNMKKKSTSRGGNIQMCVKSGVQRPICKIGAMATDDEAYKTFSDLFGPIIKDLHPNYDHRFSYKFEELKTDLIDEQIYKMKQSITKVQNFKIEVSRNFRGTPFTPLMTKEAKLQVERKVVEVLGDLYGSYSQIRNLNQKDVEWLKKVGIDAHNRSEESDAAGINDDWPVGRGIFIQDNKNFVVLVNFEEHLKIIILPEENNKQDTIQQGLHRLVKLLQTFQKLGYATDSHLGNLTVSPQNLGTAMKISCQLKFDDEFKERNLTDSLLKKLKYDKFIDYKKEEGDECLHNMVTVQTLAPDYTERLQIEDFLFSIIEVCLQIDAKSMQSNIVVQENYINSS